jgi:Uma2 family endonuclease
VTHPIHPAPVSRVPRVPLPFSDGDHYQQPEFQALYAPMAGSIKVELIAGSVFIPSPPQARHSAVHGSVSTWLSIYSTWTHGVLAGDNTAILLGTDSQPQCDACLCVQGGTSRVDQPKYLIGPPELVCEVATSEAAYDFFDKKKDYERYGVKEYVVLDIHNERAHWYARSTGTATSAFVELLSESDGVFRSPGFPGLWLDPVSLFQCDIERVFKLLEVGLASPEHEVFVKRICK